MDPVPTPCWRCRGLRRWLNDEVAVLITDDELELVAEGPDAWRHPLEAGHVGAKAA